MFTLTQEGSITGSYNAQINSNFEELGGSNQTGVVDYWVRPQNGVGNADGSWERPFGSMALAAAYMRAGVVIGLEGVLKEEFSSPKVNDITIIGAKSNLPRQATTSGTPNGGGCTWMSSSASVTTPMLQINGQGWRVQNVFFASGAGVVANPCVLLTNAGDPPSSNCAEKTALIGCWFTGTDDGVGAVDQPNNVLIDGCTFFGFSETGDKAISSTAGLGTGTLSFWTIQNCDFLGNANHITAPFSSSTIRNNHFSYIYGAVTSTTQVVLTSGANNSVYGNRFDVPYNVNGLTAMFAAGTNDRWGSNSMGTAVLTPMTGLLWGVPTSGAA